MNYFVLNKIVIILSDEVIFISNFTLINSNFIFCLYFIKEDFILNCLSHQIIHLISKSSLFLHSMEIGYFRHLFLYFLNLFRAKFIFHQH